MNRLVSIVQVNLCQTASKWSDGTNTLIWRVSAQKKRITQWIIAECSFWLFADNTFLTRVETELKHLFWVSKWTQTNYGVVLTWKIISYLKSSQWKSWEKYIFLSGPRGSGCTVKCGQDMKPDAHLSDKIWASGFYRLTLKEDIVICNNYCKK